MKATKLEHSDVMVNFSLEPVQDIYSETGERPLVQIIGLGTVGEAQAHQLAQKLDISTTDLAKIVTTDKRISKHGTKWFGESFDGKCLPKDLVNLIKAYKAEGIEPTLLQATRQINDALRRSK